MSAEYRKLDTETLMRMREAINDELTWRYRQSKALQQDRVLRMALARMADKEKAPER